MFNTNFCQPISRNRDPSGEKDMLSLSGVTKQIGGLTAVNNVDLHIGADEIVGLVGPNGAGKTTLLNIISGLLPPTTGVVTFNSEDITGLKADKICRKGI